MINMPVVNLFGFSIQVYALLMAAACALALAASVLTARRSGLRPAGAALYGVLAAALGMILARAIYCAVRWDWVFLDEMGNFSGVLSFFDLSKGGMNVIGVICGVLLAAPVAAAITREPAARYLDNAALPALALFILARAIEPLSGQGYGDLLFEPALCFFPLALANDMGDYCLAVCFIEAVLALAVLICVLVLRKGIRRSGTLAQYALVLLCLSQILPESLRWDDVLYVFVFARVTHLGLAVLLGLTLIRLLVQGGRRGLSAGAIALEAAGFVAGIGLCIATIFALDKTNLPKLLVYAVMLLSLVELGFVICRRIRLEDLRKE